MTAESAADAGLENLQRALRITHRNRVHHLTLTAREGAVHLGGEAIDFYTVQLVIRDVLAAGVRIVRNGIRVRSGRPGRGRGGNELPAVTTCLPFAVS